MLTCCGRLLSRIRISSQCANSVFRPQSVLRSSQMKFPYQYCYGARGKHCQDSRLCVFIYAQAALILGITAQPVLAEDASNESSSENNTGNPEFFGLRKVEDGSVISNVHTSKWRIFTDKGREFFQQGKLNEAEKLFSAAKQEAKEGFGDKDPHVASALNNLAEINRIKKEFDTAEPLYLEAINILEDSFGNEDVRVGAALHNLGQFYLMQRKLEQARSSYERALKIKGRVLGHGHTDYADTMYHLGIVLHLLGNDKDSEVLIQDSIRILEDAGQGESITCTMRLRYLAQLYFNSQRPAEAEIVQRKILHIVELSKGWSSLDTVIAADDLALTLRSVGNLRESKELLERCLDARKMLLPKDHIQMGANILNLARVSILNLKQLGNMDISGVSTELTAAKKLLGNSIRIAQGVLDKFVKHKCNMQDNSSSGTPGKDVHAALVILLQSLDAFGVLEMTIREMDQSTPPPIEAESAFRQCISVFQEFGCWVSDSPQVKVEYVSCLKHLLSLISDGINKDAHQKLIDEIQSIEAQISPIIKKPN